VDQSFLHPEQAPPDLSFATLEARPAITPHVIAALPAPDVALDSPCPAIKYIRRSLKDGELYFFFNESNQTQTRTATLLGRGSVAVWDASHGTIHPISGLAPTTGSVAVPLQLGPQETRFVVIGAAPATSNRPQPTLAPVQPLVELTDSWSITLGDKKLATPLKSWEELGATGFKGTANYHHDFTAPTPLPEGKRIFLDLGNVHEIARVRLNGTAFEPQAWPPYLWDVTEAIKPGANTLEIDVQVPTPTRGFGGGGANGAGRRGAPSPAPATAPPADFRRPACPVD
jgi:hypothetical protein